MVVNLCSALQVKPLFDHSTHHGPLEIKSNLPTKSFSLEYVTQGRVQADFEFLPKRRLYKLSEQPDRLLCHPERSFSHVQMELLVFQFVPIVSCTTKKSMVPST